MAKSSDSSPRSTLVAAVLCVVALLALFGALNSYQVSEEYAKQFPDAYGGERARVRFAALLARIPPTAELGYISDLDPSQPAYASAFLATQYAAAPRIVTFVGPKNKPELAIGNFTRPQDFAAAGEARGYAIEADLGNGVILFRRKSS
jgi:hypothetical protein